MRKFLLLFTLMGFVTVANPLPMTAQGGETKTVTLAVKNMTCATCPITVSWALKRVNGVIAAKADLDTASATVTFDPGKTNVEALTKATTNAGYPSTLKK